VTDAERAQRLTVAEAELRRAQDAGRRRDVAAFRIAVEVLRDLPVAA
jgi:hypothetical protein